MADQGAQAPNHADAIIVGLGASGAILAKELTAAGLRVVALDKGAQFTDEDFAFKHDEIRYHVRLDISASMDEDPVTWRTDQDSVAKILPWGQGPLHLGPLFLPPSLGTGGGTVHYSAWHWRQQPSDFRMASEIRAAADGRPLPEDLELRDWPLTYEDLEPCYERVEAEIGVSGRAGRLNGQTQEGGNPFEA